MVKVRSKDRGQRSGSKVEVKNSHGPALKVGVKGLDPEVEPQDQRSKSRVRVKGRGQRSRSKVGVNGRDQRSGSKVRVKNSVGVRGWGQRAGPRGHKGRGQGSGSKVGVKGRGQRSGLGSRCLLQITMQYRRMFHARRNSAEFRVLPTTPF